MLDHTLTSNIRDETYHSINIMEYVIDGYLHPPIDVIIWCCVANVLTDNKGKRKR